MRGAFAREQLGQVAHELAGRTPHSLRESEIVAGFPWVVSPLTMNLEPSNGFMVKTTLLMITTALMLSAQAKLTTDEKLQLSRAEAAAAKAQAILTNFVSQAQRTVQDLEQKAREANEANQKLVTELKTKHKLDAACTFDEQQEPKCPVAKEVKK